MCTDCFYGGEVRLIYLSVSLFLERDRFYFVYFCGSESYMRDCVKNFSASVCKSSYSIWYMCLVCFCKIG